MSVLRLFDQETDPAAGGGDEPPPITPHPATVVAEPEPAAPEWQAPSQEDWESQQEALGAMQQQLEDMQRFMPQAYQEPQYQQQPQAPQPPDQWSDNFQQEMADYVQWVAQQAVAPYQNAAQSWQYTEGEARRDDIIADDVAANGDLLVADQSKEMIGGLADIYYTQVYAPQYGEGPDAAQRAMGQAIADVRAYEQAIADEAVNRYRNQITGLNPARQQLPATGQTAGQTFPMPGGGDELDLVRRYTGGQGLPS